MRNKLRFTAAAATATALVLSGCGSSGGSGDGTTITMVETLTNPGRTQVIRQLISDFEKAHPDIEVELISPPTNQADQKLQQMLQSGRGVDVFEAKDTKVGPYAANGWVYDMTSDLESWDGWDELTENAVTYSKQDGKTNYIPYGFYGLSLFYRTDRVQEAGFSGPPASWPDLLEQAQALNKPDENQFGYAFRGGTNAQGNAVAVIEAYLAEDVDTENAFLLKSGGTIFADPRAKQAMDDYFQLFAKGSPPSSVAWGYPEMVQGFSGGSTAFLLQDPEVIATVRGSDAITEEQWSVAPMPVGPSGKAIQPIASAGWGIAESSEQKPEAIELIKFLSSGDAATTFDKENSLVPILRTAQEDEFYSTGPWAAYVEMTNAPETYINAVQPRGVAWWTEWEQKADSDIQRVLVGDLNTADMLAGWDEYWTTKLAENK
ncbi:ABC transporter substrate-binding protein [Kineosporia babensis]|uniref:Sugar ABC transporter substrate-binding protein n=1 Tax=Kineosporia babensis TaxID=499548 RepID=A0A9X1NQ53_9ACTN|nr:sugar ABC transporter substrate-binding protein [Kineosporia babensis]MCD5317118.1 sugar ABC transporter substrate-binding protein [Kineosporia babensis]